MPKDLRRLRSAAIGTPLAADAAVAAAAVALAATTIRFAVAATLAATTIALAAADLASAARARDARGGRPGARLLHGRGQGVAPTHHAAIGADREAHLGAGGSLTLH